MWLCLLSIIAYFLILFFKYLQLFLQLIRIFTLCRRLLLFLTILLTLWISIWKIFIILFTMLPFCKWRYINLFLMILCRASLCFLWVLLVYLYWNLTLRMIRKQLYLFWHSYNVNNLCLILLFIFLCFFFISDTNLTFFQLIIRIIPLLSFINSLMLHRSNNIIQHILFFLLKWKWLSSFIINLLFSSIALFRVFCVTILFFIFTYAVKILNIRH